MPRRRLSVLLFVVLGFSFTVHAADDPVEARMRADITFLASDECEGRGPGTAGIDKAADHIAAAFRAAGLKGALPDGSYFQPFAVRGTPKVGKDTGVIFQYPGDDTLTSLALGDPLQPI